MCGRDPSIPPRRFCFPPTHPSTHPPTSSEMDGKKKLVFALPGNPVSCLVCSHLLVAPALRRLKGLPPAASLPPQARRLLLTDDFDVETPLPPSTYTRRQTNHLLITCPTQGAKLTTSLSRIPHQVPVALAAPTRLDPERPEYQRVVVAWDEGRQVRTVGLDSQSVSQSVSRSSGEFARRWKWKGRMDGPCTPTDPNTHRAGLCGPHHGAANLLPPPLHARRQRPPLPPRRQRYAVVYTGCIHTPTHHRHAHLSAHPTQLTRADTLSAGTHVPCLLIGPLPPPPSRLPTHAFPKAAALGGGAEETGGGKSGR